MVVLRKILSRRKKSVGMLFQISGFVLFIYFHCFKVQHLFFSVGGFKIYAVPLIMLIFREKYNFCNFILSSRNFQHFIWLCFSVALHGPTGVRHQMIFQRLKSTGADCVSLVPVYVNKAITSICNQSYTKIYQIQEIGNLSVSFPFM